MGRIARLTTNPVMIALVAMLAITGCASKKTPNSAADLGLNGADRGRVRVEEDAVADVDGEVLRRAGRCGTRAIEAEIGSVVRGLLRGATGDGKHRDQGDHCRVSG